MHKTIGYYFLFFFLLLGAKQIVAQPKIVEIKTPIIDSLTALINQTNADSIKILLWCDIAKAQQSLSLELAVETAEKAQRYAKRLNNIELVGWSKLTLGQIYFSYDKVRIAFEAFEEAKALADSSDISRLKINTRLALGDYYLRQESYGKAISSLLEASVLMQDAALTDNIGETLNKIGVAHQKTDNNKAAFQFHRDALAVFEAAKNQVGVAESYINLGNTFLSQDDFAEAIEYFEAALNLAKATSDNQTIGKTYFNIGKAKYENEQYELALEAFLNASDLIDVQQNPSLLASVFSSIGLTLLQQSKTEEGIEYERKALSIYRSNNDFHGVAMSYNRLGSNYLSHFGSTQAVEYLESALTLNTELEMPLRQCENYLNLGYAYYHQSQYDKALNEVKKGIRIADDLDSKPLKKDANELLSLLYASKKQFRNAYIAQQEYENLSDTLEINKKKFRVENSAENRIGKVNPVDDTVKKLRFWTILFGVVILLLVYLNVYFYRGLTYARGESMKYEAMLQQRQEKEEGKMIGD